MTDNPNDRSESELEPLLSEFGEDPDMAELVLYFVGELDNRIKSLNEAHTSGDSSALRSLAHQLKGAAEGYGYPTITQEAGSLESAIDTESDISQITEKFEALILLCRRASAGAPQMDS